MSDSIFIKTVSVNIKIQRRQKILRLNESIRQERSLRKLERKKYVSNVVRFRSRKKEEDEPRTSSTVFNRLGLFILN